MNRPQFPDRQKRDFSVPEMGEAAKGIESGLYSYLIRSAGITGMRNEPGTGIIVATDRQGRVFKVEISQVDGPA